MYFYSMGYIITLRNALCKSNGLINALSLQDDFNGAFEEIASVVDSYKEAIK